VAPRQNHEPTSISGFAEGGAHITHFLKKRMQTSTVMKKSCNPQKQTITRAVVALAGLLAVGAWLSPSAQAQTNNQINLSNNNGTLTSNNEWAESFNLYHTDNNAYEGGEFITHTMNLYYEGHLSSFWDGLSIFSRGSEMLRLTNNATFFSDMYLVDSRPRIFFRNDIDTDGFELGRESSGTDHAFIYNRANGYIKFGTNDTQRMLITADGKVSIGASAPSTTFHINPTSFTEAALTNSSSGLLLLGGTGGLNLVMDNNEIMARNNGGIAELHLQTEGGNLMVHDNATAGTEFVILDNGNVGVAGITTPTAALSVGEEIISYRSHTDTNNFLAIGHGGSNGYVTWDGNGSLDFRYNGSSGVDDNLMRLSQAGQLVIGAGDFTPTATLDVRGNGAITGALTVGTMGNYDNLLNYGGGRFYSDDQSASVNEFTTIGHGGDNGFVYWDGDGHFDFRYGDNGGKGDNLMRLSQGGSLLIGGGSNISSATAGATLDVRGDAVIHGMTKVKELYIDANGNWADYVFADTYQLRPLSEVASYIEENHHLPDVPSAEEVAEHGYAQTEVNETLLRKIEELTLYMIELKAENEELRSMIEQSQTQEDRN